MIQRRFILAYFILFLMLIGCKIFSPQPLIQATPDFNTTRTSLASERDGTSTAIILLVTTTPLFSHTPGFTSTPIPPTATPALGSFNNPAPLNMSFTANESNYKKYEMKATLLEEKRGEEANQLAKDNSQLLYYQQPIEGQEYLAVKMRLEIIREEPEKVTSLYPFYHLTLRYSEEGDDIWSVNNNVPWIEGYTPIAGEGWVFFLIRKGSTPFLYFHPYLIVTEQLGVRIGGIFFALN